MNRYFALILGLAWPLCASAFQDQVVHLKGVTVTATRSATRLCGVDFLIAVSDRDRHFVMIDFTYNGAFTTRAAWESVPALAERGSRGGVINVSVGPLTWGGMLDRAAANEWPENTLVCTEAWAFHFVASEVNESQAMRDKDAGLRQKAQDKIDAAKRRKAEEEERKRKAAQLQLDYLKVKEQAKYDALANYRKNNPESANCILRVDDPDSIKRCDQSTARIREIKRQQAVADAHQREIDAAAQQLDQESSERVAKVTRDMEANNCGYSAGAPRIPYPTVNTNQAQYLAEIKRIDALNYETQQKFFRETEAASDACRARKAKNPCEAAEIEVQRSQRDLERQYPSGQLNQAQTNQRAQARAQWEQWKKAKMLEAGCAATNNKQQETLQIQAQQQRRLQAQQKARSDLDAAILEGKKTVNQAETNTQIMKNDNADLMDRINRLK